MLKMGWFWLLGESRGKMEAVARDDAELTLVWKGCQLRLSCSCVADSISLSFQPSQYCPELENKVAERSVL